VSPLFCSSFSVLGTFAWAIWWVFFLLLVESLSFWFNFSCGLWLESAKRLAFCEVCGVNQNYDLGSLCILPHCLWLVSTWKICLENHACWELCTQFFLATALCKELYGRFFENFRKLSISMFSMFNLCESSLLFQFRGWWAKCDLIFLGSNFEAKPIGMGLV
jgi:hypothetical protein